MRRDPNPLHASRTPRQLWYLTALIGLGFLAIAAIWPGRDMGFDPALAAGLAAAFFATRLLTIRLPQGDDVYVTLVVGLVALAVADITVAVAASALAGVVESIARFSQSSRPAAVSRALDATRATAVLALMAPWQLVLHRSLSATAHDDTLIMWLLVAGMMYSGLDILTMAVQQRIAGGLPVIQGIATLQRPLATMYLVHLAMAAVAVRLYAESASWAFPIALLLTLILQNSFNLYLRIRRGYADTIGALAHAAELDRPHDSGHARRVADLAVAVGRRMGLSSRELERIGYAALLHDIGRMGDVGDDMSGVHAHRGAEIVTSIPFLEDVAPLIERPCEDDAARQPVGAEIVRVCSHYDRLRANVGAQQALDELIEESGGLSGRVLEILNDVVRNPHARVGAVR
ncbi:MAG: HDIG domain-containing protein [Coriobacteriia bacterium]|nr:HDIG domain-containing protein [Coriobacteriia bacterium]